MAEIKVRYGNALWVIGNVNCGKLDTGTDEEVIASARYDPQPVMPGEVHLLHPPLHLYRDAPRAV